MIHPHALRGAWHAGPEIPSRPSPLLAPAGRLVKAEASSTQRLTVSSLGKARLSVLVRVLQWPELIQHQIFVERMKGSKHLHPVLLCIICSEKGGAGYSSSGVQSAGRG